MIINLAGKTAIITGSSAGIGWGCAQGLAAAGAAVVLTGRYEKKLATARDRLLASVPTAAVRFVVGDLSTASGCDALAKVEPACDILVNNLGFWEPKSFFEITDEGWERSLQVNLMPGVRLSRAYLPAMMERRWGRIVFLSSEAGINLPTDSLHYGVAKTAVLGLSRGLAKLARGSGVTVNAVLPGVTMVEWVEAMVSGIATQQGQGFEEAGLAAVKARYPSSIDQRIHSVEEVANLVVYACSMQASATTGSALRADGGIVESII
jgi:NAD(P)-dependent dehydrogenase (short-subunit alcohol dehydrogenase family)